jgi:carboxyl-terminal processing protease
MGRGRGVLFVAGLAACTAGAYVAYRALDARSVPATIVVPAPPTPQAAAEAGTEPEEDERAYSFRVPSGEPAALTCDAARAIVNQVRTGLAYEPEPVSPRALASGTADWLDPHGLWSAAPDAPIEAALTAHAAELVHTLEGQADADCAPAREVGAQLVTWVGELRKRFDAERLSQAGKPGDVAGAADDSMFEAGAEARSARELASILGRRIGGIERGLGAAAAPYASAARARFFPELDANGWAKVVLAAAVRSYVQIVDPHGAWAPFDEEASVYEVDLESHPPDRLWDRASRTAIGVRIGSQPVAPLQVDDVLLALADVPTAGLPLEQIEQLGFTAPGSLAPLTAVVLRAGETVVRTLNLTATSGAEAPSSMASGVPDDLPVDRVPYAAGDALVVRISDVRDDLGEELSRALLRARESDTRPLLGVVLDLRGNGGGSTEGAIAALGLFLPGAPLFPMKRRDGTIETDRAPEPPTTDRWTGAVATLVDEETASAAEMIAGALAVYRRGASVGTPTYGKGCAQEYVDDDAHTGVLRLTTLLYALPDGAPVQRVGLAPTILLPTALTSSPPAEREATLSHAPPSWRGPDVREQGAPPGLEASVTWPSHGGSVGPCKDTGVCRALRALGSAGTKRVSSAKPPR